MYQLTELHLFERSVRAVRIDEMERMGEKPTWNILMNSNIILLQIKRKMSGHLRSRLRTDLSKN